MHGSFCVWFMLLGSFRAGVGFSYGVSSVHRNFGGDIYFECDYYHLNLLQVDAPACQETCLLHVSYPCDPNNVAVHRVTFTCSDDVATDAWFPSEQPHYLYTTDGMAHTSYLSPLINQPMIPHSPSMASIRSSALKRSYHRVRWRRSTCHGRGRLSEPCSSA